MPQAAMPWIMGAGVASSIYGANQASKASKAAGNAQAQSAAESAQLQREAMQQMRAASEPFRFAGQQAINPLFSMLGLGQIPLPQQPLFTQTGEMYGQRRQTLQDELAQLQSQLNSSRGGV